MKKIVYTAGMLLILFCPVLLLGQGEIDEQRRILLRNERTFGVFLNSNGFGADFSYAKRINARNHTLYQGELMLVKHPKEIRITNNIYSNKTFVFGKKNSFFELKGYWGRHSEIYRKNDAGSLSIRYFYAAGPVIGLLKPIYYEVLYTSGNPWEIYSKIEKFSTSTHQSNIYGKASFFQGINEMKILPGVTSKIGFTFEYSRADAAINALEIGMGFDIFPKDIPIMATETNDFFFLNLFAGYRFGKVIDISDAAQSKSWLDRWKEDRQRRKIMKEQKRLDSETDNF